jgi:hypothetical protein
MSNNVFNNNHEILSDEENIDPIVVVRNTSIQSNSSNQVLNSHSSKSASTIHSGTKLQKSAKYREIDWSYKCLQQLDKFLISSEWNDRKR